MLVLWALSHRVVQYGASPQSAWLPFAARVQAALYGRDDRERGGFFAILGLVPIPVPAAPAAKEAKPAISEDASGALLRMGQALSANQFSFQARTIRVYTDAGGEPPHIFHILKVTVQRPNRVSTEVTGDDGSDKLVFDGKTPVIFSAQNKKYATMSVSEGTTIDGMLKEAVGRYGIDFPLADFLSEAPNTAFLTGVTSDRVVNTVAIDGTPYDHLFFFQPPGIELELWLPKTGQAVPRRLIVTYRTLPANPTSLRSSRIGISTFIRPSPNLRFSRRPGRSRSP